MNNLEKILTTIFGGVITLAIVATFVGKNSKAPQAIQATGSFIGNIVAAAVAPINTASTNGNIGTSAFTTPTVQH